MPSIHKPTTLAVFIASNSSIMPNIISATPTKAIIMDHNNFVTETFGKSFRSIFPSERVELTMFNYYKNDYLQKRLVYLNNMDSSSDIKLPVSASSSIVEKSSLLLAFKHSDLFKIFDTRLSISARMSPRRSVTSLLSFRVILS